MHCLPQIIKPSSGLHAAVQSLVLSLSCQHKWHQETWWYCVTSHLQCSLKHLACNPKRLCVHASLPLICGLFWVEHVTHHPHPPTVRLKTRWDQSPTHIIMDKLCMTSNRDIGFSVWLRQCYLKGCKKTPSRWGNMHSLHQRFQFSPLKVEANWGVWKGGLWQGQGHVWLWACEWGEICVSLCANFG